MMVIDLECLYHHDLPDLLKVDEAIIVFESD
jgi:hypothetical protein